MKHLFYDDWTKRRVDRICSTLGKSWFVDKTVLELGAAHGDIGIEFLKLGATVIFSDARLEHLNGICERLQKLDYYPDCITLNQNEGYSLPGRSFDLILHLGTLYHVENWQRDLESAMNHTNMMFLETIVDPSQGTVPQMDMRHPTYGPYKCKNSHFTQEQIEDHLKELGCKFIRFDDADLNSSGWLTKDKKDNHWYNWTYENYMTMQKPGFNHFRRMWLVLR